MSVAGVEDVVTCPVFLGVDPASRELLVQDAVRVMTGLNNARVGGAPEQGKDEFRTARSLEVGFFR